MGINKDEYIENVIRYLLEDTHFYHYKGWGGGYNGGNLIAIDFPMYPEETLFYEFDIIINLYNGDEWVVGSEDIKYINNTYGITDIKEITEIFQVYKFRLAEMILPLIDEVLSQDNTLNESVISRDDYMDRIIDFMIEDTSVDLQYLAGATKPRIIIKYPMEPGEGNEYYFSEDHINMWVSGDFKWDLASEDVEYAKDYGITNMEEIKTMYTRYMKKLCALILQRIEGGEGQLNESMEKIDSYLKRVVDWLVEDTKYTINYGGHMSTVDIHFPMNDYDQPTEYGVGELYHEVLPQIMRMSPSWYPVYSESKYISDQYGLESDTEIRKVFNEYLKILFTNIVEDAKRIKRINRGGSVNESADRRSAYLEQIVKYLMDDTIINYNLSLIAYPFMESKFGAFTFTPATMFSSEAPFSFGNYVMGNYDITWDEAEYVWRKYSNILMDEFRKG